MLSAHLINPVLLNIKIASFFAWKTPKKIGAFNCKIHIDPLQVTKNWPQRPKGTKPDEKIQVSAEVAPALQSSFGRHLRASPHVPRQTIMVKGQH